MWLHSHKVAQLLRSAACLHTNQSRSYLNHLVIASRLSDALQVLDIVMAHVYLSIATTEIKTFTNMALKQLFKNLYPNVSV